MVDRHYQCSLERLEKDGTKTFTTSWLPEKFARFGQYLELKNAKGEWVNGWKVTGVSGSGQESKWINERSQDYKNMRKVTDI